MPGYKATGPDRRPGETSRAEVWGVYGFYSSRWSTTNRSSSFKEQKPLFKNTDSILQYSLDAKPFENRSSPKALKAEDRQLRSRQQNLGRLQPKADQKRLPYDPNKQYCIEVPSSQARTSAVPHPSTKVDVTVNIRTQLLRSRLKRNYAAAFLYSDEHFQVIPNSRSPTAHKILAKAPKLQSFDAHKFRVGL